MCQKKSKNQHIYNQLYLESNKKEPQVCKDFEVIAGDLGSVIMVDNRENCQVLLSVFVEFFEHEDISLNLRVDNNG